MSLERNCIECGTKTRIYIVNDNGKIYCRECHSINMFIDDLSTPTKPKLKLKPEPLKTSSTEQSVFCRKCQKSFTTPSCKCGFKNPLMR